MPTSSLHLCSTPALYSSTTCTAVSRLVVCSSQAAKVSAYHSNVPSGSGDWSSGGGTLFHATRALRALMPVAVAHSETFGSFRHSNRAAAGTWWRSSTETASRVKCGKPDKVKDPFQSVFLPMHGCTEVEMTRRSPTPPPDFPLDSLPIYEPHDQNGPPRTKISFHLPMRSLPVSLALDFFFPGANPTDHSQAINTHSISRAYDSGEAASGDFGASYEKADNDACSEHQHTSRSDRVGNGKERSCVAGADRVAGDTSTAFCRLCRENFDNDGTLRSHITVADRARHVSHPVREVALETLTLLAVRGYPIDHIMAVWADVLYSCPLFPRIRSMTNPRWSIEERASQIGIILRALKRVGVLDVALATAEPTDTGSSVNSHYRRRRVAFERLEYIGDNCWGNNISNRILLLYPDQQWLYSERCSTFTLVRDACEMNVNLDFVFDTLQLWQLLSATAHSRLGNGKVKADLVEGILGELHLYLYGMVPKLQDDVEYVETNGAREVQLVALVEHCLTELYDLIVLKHARDLVTSAIPLAKELAAKRIWARTRPFLLQQRRPNTGRARAKASPGSGAPHASTFPSTGHTAPFPSLRVGAATATASSATLEDLFDVSPSSLQQQHTSVCGVRSGAIELNADGRTESAAVSGSSAGHRQNAEKRAGKVAAEASKRDGRMPASIHLGSTRVLPALPGLFATPHVCSERVPNPLRLLPLSAIPSITYCHHTRSDVFATMKKSYERLGLLQDESRRMRCTVSPTPPAWAVLIGTLLPQLVGFAPKPVAPAGDTKAASAEARRLLASMDEGGLYCRDAFYNLAASPSAPAAAGRPHASLSPMDTAWMLQNTGLPPLSATPSKSRENYDDVSSDESPCRRCTFAPSRYVPPGTRTPPAGVVTDRNLCRGTFAFLAVGVENAVAEAEKLTRSGTMLASGPTQADPTTGVGSLGEGPTQHSTEKKSPGVSAAMYAERVKAAVDYWQRRPQKPLQRFSAPSGEASLPH